MFLHHCSLIKVEINRRSEAPYIWIFYQLQSKTVRNFYHFQIKHIFIQSETADQRHPITFNHFDRSQKNSQSSLITSRLKVKAKNRAVQTHRLRGARWHLVPCYWPVASLKPVFSSSFMGGGQISPPATRTNTHTHRTDKRSSKQTVLKCSVLK